VYFIVPTKIVANQCLPPPYASTITGIGE